MFRSNNNAVGRLEHRIYPVRAIGEEAFVLLWRWWNRKYCWRWPVGLFDEIEGIAGPLFEVHFGGEWRRKDLEEAVGFDGEW